MDESLHTRGGDRKERKVIEFNSVKVIFRNEHIIFLTIANHFLHIVFYPLNPCPKLFSSLNDMPK